MAGQHSAGTRIGKAPRQTSQTLLTRSFPACLSLDIGSKFLEPDGTLSLEIMPDLLHPNEKGYQIWAEAIENTLDELMK